MKWFKVIRDLFSSVSQSPEDQWLVGGLYATPAEEGGFTILKMLKIDDYGVHIRIYSNDFSQVPTTIDESKLYMVGMTREEGEKLGMGHLPISKEAFASWKIHLIQESTVSSEELEGYQIWKDAPGGYFD